MKKITKIQENHQNSINHPNSTKSPKVRKITKVQENRQNSGKLPKFRKITKIQENHRGREGQLHTPHDPILASLESLGFLEILRLFKFEEIITMVSRSGGGATPPSVMALFSKQILKKSPKSVLYLIGVQCSPTN